MRNLSLGCHALAMMFAIFAALLMGVVLLSFRFTTSGDVVENSVSHDETSWALPASVCLARLCPRTPIILVSVCSDPGPPARPSVCASHLVQHNFTQ